MLLERVQREIVARRLMSPGSRGLVALSGGPDSLCLLHLLARLQSTLGVAVRAAVVDHGLRPESEAEARRAAELSLGLGVTPVVLQAGLASVVAERGGNVQERARMARLGLLESLAREAGEDWVALGHTAQDQAETVLMRAVRGAGTSGLCGMRWQRGLFIRPLLGIERREVEQYLVQHVLDPIRDPTNQTDRYLRNRIRRQVLPLLERENPRVVHALCRLAESHQLDDEALDRAARQALESARDGAGIALGPLRDLPRGLRHRVLRLFCVDHRGSARRIDRRHIEELDRLIDGAFGTRRVDLPGLSLERRYGHLVPCSEPAPWPEVALSAEGRMVPAGGWEITVRAQPPDDTSRPIAELDATRVQFPLVLRPRRPGDRVLIGPALHKKVGRVLIDARVPRAVRASVPLLLAGEEIVLILGVRTAFGYGAKPGRPSLLVYARERCASAASSRPEGTMDMDMKSALTSPG